MGQGYAAFTLESPPVGYSSGDVFDAYDDDDKYLNELGLAPSLPRHEKHMEVIDAIRNVYASAYIDVVDANAMTYANGQSWNPRKTIPFQANLASIYNLDIPSGMANSMDLEDTPTFWAHLIVFAYQPNDSFDGDPNSEQEDMHLGETPKAGYDVFDRYSGFGFSAIYIEPIRESVFMQLEVLDQSNRDEALNDPEDRQTFIDTYNDLIAGTVAHEIGHSPGEQHADDDHAEGGLMDVDSPYVGDPNDPNQVFKPKTILRFRKTSQWKGDQ